MNNSIARTHYLQLLERNRAANEARYALLEVDQEMREYRDWMHSLDRTLMRWMRWMGWGKRD